MIVFLILLFFAIYFLLRDKQQDDNLQTKKYLKTGLSINHQEKNYNTKYKIFHNTIEDVIEIIEFKEKDVLQNHIKERLNTILNSDDEQKRNNVLKYINLWALSKTTLSFEIFLNNLENNESDSYIKKLLKNY